MSSTDDIGNFLTAEYGGLTQRGAEDALVDLFTRNQHGRALWDRINTRVSSSRRVAKRCREGRAKVFSGQEAVRLILDLNIPKRRYHAIRIPL